MSNYHLQEMSQLIFLKLWYWFLLDLYDCSEIIFNDEVVDYHSRMKSFKNDLSIINKQLDQTIKNYNEEKSLMELYQKHIKEKSKEKKQLEHEYEDAGRDYILANTLIDREGNVSETDIKKMKAQRLTGQIFKIIFLVISILLAGILAWEWFMIIRQIISSWGYDLSYIFSSTFFAIIMPATVLLFGLFLFLFLKLRKRVKIKNNKIEKALETYGRIERLTKRAKQIEKHRLDLKRQMLLIDLEISNFENDENHIDEYQKEKDRLEKKKKELLKKCDELDQARCQMRIGVGELFDEFLRQNMPLLNGVSLEEANHLFAYLYLGLEDNINDARKRYQRYLKDKTSNPSVNTKYRLSLMDSLVSDCDDMILFNPTIDSYVNQTFDHFRSYIYFHHSEPYFLLTKIDADKDKTIPTFFYYDSSSNELRICKETTNQKD